MMWEEPKVYAVKHKDLHIRMESRSGGIFTVLSDEVLKQGGIVYGCILTKDFKAIHVRTDNEYERNRMRGSKYIQSELNDIFLSVKRDLDTSKLVLFSGTSCQVSGLKGFLQREYDNLFCMDVVCHGVPSPKVWKDYIKWQERKNKGQCVGADFRDKKNYGWEAHIETLQLKQNNGLINAVHSEVFKTLFYGHTILRPCCYQCPYKSTLHPSEITVADYWGVDRAAPGFNDNKGISLVFINNDAGAIAFENGKSEFDWKETLLADSMQTAFVKPHPRPKERDDFWKDYFSRDFEVVAKRYGEYGFVNTCKKQLDRCKGSVKSKAKRLFDRVASAFINFSITMRFRYYKR